MPLVLLSTTVILFQREDELSNAIYLCAGILNIIVVYLLVKFIGNDGIAYAVLFTEAFVAIVLFITHIFISTLRK